MTLSIMTFHANAKCRYGEWSQLSPFSEFHYEECHYDVCCYAECRGAFSSALKYRTDKLECLTIEALLKGKDQYS